MEESYSYETTIDFPDSIQQHDFSVRSYGVIEAGSKEASDIDIFYKGKKVVNCVRIEFYGAELQFEEEDKPILNWKERIGDFDG